MIAPAPQNTLPTRITPDTRVLSWVLIDSTTLTNAVVQAAAAKALNHEYILCLRGGVLHELLPDSVLVVHGYPADSVTADSTDVTFKCAGDPYFVGTLHTHIHMQFGEQCMTSVAVQHVGKPRVADDFSLLLNDDQNIIDYLLCDNGWVFWELKDGRLHAFRVPPW